jgi:hypothetical protein
MNRRAFLTGAPAAAAASATLIVRHADGRELELDFGVLRLQPGDRVVLSLPGHADLATLERIRDSAGLALPAGVTAIVLSEGIKIEGILRGAP